MKDDEPAVAEYYRMLIDTLEYRRRDLKGITRLEGSATKEALNSILVRVFRTGVESAIASMVVSILAVTTSGSNAILTLFGTVSRMSLSTTADVAVVALGCITFGLSAQRLFRAITGPTLFAMRERRMKVKYYPGAAITEIIQIRNSARISRAVIALSTLLLLNNAIAWLRPDLSSSAVSIIALCLIVVMMLNERMLYFRVSRGFFGNNRDEASYILSFLNENRQRIDFTDGGRPKRLVPMNVEAEIVERVTPWVTQP